MVLYVVVPKGFFPLQDTGVLLGIYRGARSRLLRGDGRAPAGAGAGRSRQDPAVASLSSFIGVDGTNTTLNSGRILVNLKPLAERAESAIDVIRRLQPRARRASQGIHLYLQPVQDLTVESQVSRTQYQYSLEDPDADELRRVRAAAGRGAADAPGAARRRAATSRTTGLQMALDIDRDHRVAPRHHARS